MRNIFAFFKNFMAVDKKLMRKEVPSVSHLTRLLDMPADFQLPNFLEDV